MRADVDCDLEVTRRNLHWILNPSDFVQSEFFWTGSKDTWDTYHVLKLLKPGDVIFDIGANFGYYSIVACAELGGPCRVFAFEPNAPSYARLVKNINLNEFGGRIKAFQLALSDAGGTGWIVELPGNTGDARVSSTAGDRQVSLASWDEFCAEHDIGGIDFVKIDVQGYEEKVLLGGKNTLKRFAPALLIELDPPILRAQGCSEDRIMEILLGYGYKLFVAARDRLVPFSLPVRDGLVNVFCLQGGRITP